MLKYLIVIFLISCTKYETGTQNNSTLTQTEIKLSMGDNTRNFFKICNSKTNMCYCREGYYNNSVSVPCEFLGDTNGH